MLGLLLINSQVSNFNGFICFLPRLIILQSTMYSFWILGMHGWPLKKLILSSFPWICYRKKERWQLQPGDIRRRKLNYQPEILCSPTEYPISRMSLIMEFPEYCRWSWSIAWSQFPRASYLICFIYCRSIRHLRSSVLAIDMVAASASAAASH